MSWRAAGVSVRNVSAVVAVATFVVDDQQDDAQEEADCAHGDVGDAQERVLASHPGDGAQDHPLPAVEAANRVIWVQMVKDGNNSELSTLFFPPAFSDQLQHEFRSLKFSRPTFYCVFSVLISKLDFPRIFKLSNVVCTVSRCDFNIKDTVDDLQGVVPSW